MTRRTGRPRRYDLSETSGFADPAVGFFSAWIAELRERVVDQIIGLPAETLNYVPGETKLSIARLVRHLAWAEVAWIRRVGAPEPAEDLAEFVETDALSGFGSEPAPARSAAQLITAVRRAASEIVEPALRRATDIDAEVIDDGTTLRGVLMHLQWHWTYHSGQIGLLQFDRGSDYEWTMHRPMCPAPKLLR